ncbi:hypothetical protein OQA88_8392 [Cercophora sp. LCS_1]
MKLRRSALSICLFSLFLGVSAQAGFPFESTQLTDADVKDLSFLGFGGISQPQPSKETTPCRAWPDSKDWPSDEEWKQLNSSLGGSLLRPNPPAAVCYQGEHYDAARCRWLMQQAGRTNFWIEDPLVVLTQWPQGSTCTAAPNAKGNCTRGGFPEYVVNATTVKHIQAAINFARNKNVRLVIKNTGHDFGGRSTGAGSLSIWVHRLKDFEFIANYTAHGYSGMAVRVGAGMESWEMSNHAADHNITVLSPGGSTVGMVGGWFSAGGHGGLTSKLGLGSDQALSINVVTADGRFLTTDPETNADLWWALRGGGPSTFGVITSVVVRAYPPIRSTSVSVGFSVDPNARNSTGPAPGRPGGAPGGFPGGFPSFNGTNTTIPFPNATSPFPNATIPRPPRRTSPGTLTNLTTFWTGVKHTYRFCPRIQALGGYCYSYIYSHGNSSFSFTHSHSVPDISGSAMTALMAPLYTTLQSVGINLTMPRIPDRPPSTGKTARRTGGGDSPVNTRYRSRLFPAENWEDDALWEKTWATIQRGVEEGGYTFHGIAYSAKEKEGWESAVNPAWRKTVLHGSYMETQPVGISAKEARERDKRVQIYTDAWREVTPGAGSYMNEGDPMEKGWQQSFFGANYGRLLEMKRKWDPWGVFWAQTTVGSEGWEVKSEDGYPGSQNGRLCRVGG